MIDLLKKKAAEQIGSLSEEKLREQYRKGLDQAEKLLPKAGFEAGDKKLGAIYLMGSQGLKILREHETEFGRLGLAGATVVVTELSAGDLDQATAAFLMTQAGWSDLFKAMGEARTADAAQERARREAVDKAKAFLKEVGEASLTYVLPFLLKAAVAAL